MAELKEYVNVAWAAMTPSFIKRVTSPGLSVLWQQGAAASNSSYKTVFSTKIVLQIL